MSDSNEKSLYSEFKLNLNNLDHSVIHLLMKETNWDSLSELNVKYDKPIQFTIKIPNKNEYLLSKSKNIKNTNNLIHQIENLTENLTESIN